MNKVAAVHPARQCLMILLTLAATPLAADETSRKEAYFGELHLHSSWSIDAYAFGNRAGPEQALKYARGEAITHPGGFKVQLDQPLDFTVVMDHAEYTGSQVLADDRDSLFNREFPLTASLVRFGK